EETPKRLKKEALLRGFSLKQARNWLGSRFDDIPTIDRDFILHSKKRMQLRRFAAGVAVGAIMAAVVTSGVWWQWPWVRERFYALLYARPLSVEQEQLLDRNEAFTECTDCPKMAIVHPGSITIGSLVSPDEGPPHTVTINRPFAVSIFE